MPASVIETRQAVLLRWRRVAGATLLFLSMWAGFAQPWAADSTRSLEQRVTSEILAAIYPEAERVGAAAGSPPALPAYKGNDIVGYVFSTLDVVRAPGYSSVPFDILAGVAADGTITGAKVIYHSEPHILDSPKRQDLLGIFLASHKGHPYRETLRSAPRPDFVAGATVSAIHMRAAVFDSARYVMQGRSNRPPITEPTLDLDGFRVLDWNQLLADGLVVRRTITNAEIISILAEKTGRTPSLGDASGLFSDLYIALATPQAVARNLLGADAYKASIATLAPGAQAILVASAGPYDFVGVAYSRRSSNYRFDRVRLLQGEMAVEFDRDRYFRIGQRSNLQLGMLSNALVFIVPPSAGFDPLRPWTLEFGVGENGGPGDPVATFPVTYQIPKSLVLLPDPPPVPVWVQAWQDKMPDLIGLGVLLAALSLILALQQQLSRHRRVHRWVRIGYLGVVLVWLGWDAGGQLTIIHLANYAVAPFRNFDWNFYITEPLIVVLTLYLAASLILLGRGVYCGWLCPFGALQELLAHVARAIRLPALELPDWLDRRLRLGKYVAAALALAGAFVSAEAAEYASEIEPFRTAITAHFDRSWPYLIYAIILLCAGLFVERFYCRFLCPLGGALALLGRVHLFDTLLRRSACGASCRLCERSCPVKAVERSGRINMAECFQCLDCQVEYHDDRRCPPLAIRRKQRAPSIGIQMGPGIGVQKGTP